MAENPEDLQHLLDVVYLFSMRWGFSWNIKKSNLMRFTSSDKKLLRKKVYLGPEELKQTNVYKYLGIELDHKLNYRMARELVRRKARKAIVLAINAFRKGLEFKAGQRIWLNMIRPILEYGAEIWSARKEDDLERLQLQVGKALLGVGKSCASEVVRGELGWNTVMTRIDLMRLKLWLKMKKMQNERLLKKVFVYRVQTSANKHNSWSWKVKQILESIHMGHMWNSEDIPPNLIREFKERLKDRDRELWRQGIQKKTKLTLYQMLKFDIQQEDYLSCVPLEKRRWLTKFRGSNSDLRIETGRWQNIPRQARVCNMCNNGNVEDEFHALVQCQAYNKEREDLYNEISHKTRGTLDLRRMVHNKDWMLLVLLRPGIGDRKTTNIITRAVCNYLSYIALQRQRLQCNSPD